MGKLSVLAASIGLLASPLAAQPAGGAWLSDACRAEIKTLCGASVDRKARRACMMENRSKVSDGCRAELKARRDARQARRSEQSAKPE